MSEFVDEKGPRTTASRVAGSAPVEETIEENHFSRSHGGGRQEEHVDRSPERRWGDTVAAKIDEIVARETPKKPAPAHEQVADTAKPDDAPAPETPAVDKPPADKPAPTETTTTETPSSDEVVNLRAERDRAFEANRKLVAELEAERKKPAASPHKLLLEASDGYITDSMPALRKFIAGSLGLDDPNDARVTAEIKDLYTDLTASELQVTPDTAHQAKREAARARALLEREKRERKAEADKPAASPDDTAAFIGNRLSAKASEYAEKYPYLMTVAEQLDGKKPHDRLAEVIKREVKTGRIPITPDDDAMIAQAAHIVEEQLSGLVEKFSKAKPQPSTAKPTTQPSTSASKEAPTKTAGRNLTSADASVAPATPPAPKTEATPTNKPPKFKNDKERREWALRRFDR